MPRTAPCSNRDGGIRLCFFLLYLQPGQAIFLLKSGSQCKVIPQARVIWEYKNNSPPLACVVPEQLLSVEWDGDHRSSPIPKPQREKASLWGWEQWAGSTMDQKLMQKTWSEKVLCGPGVWIRNPALGQTHLYSCGNSDYNTGPLFHSYICKSESRVQHQEFKLASISIPFYFKIR